MTEWVSHKDKNLGRIKLDGNTNKFVFIAEDLESLITLFRLSDSDEIKTEGRGKITYKVFKHEYLEGISSFYPSFEHWLLKNKQSKTLREYESEQ